MADHLSGRFFCTDTEPSMFVHTRAGPKGAVTHRLTPMTSQPPLRSTVQPPLCLCHLFTRACLRCSTHFKEYFKVWRLSRQLAGSHMPLDLYLYTLERWRQGSHHTAASWWHLCVRVILKLYLLNYASVRTRPDSWMLFLSDFVCSYIFATEPTLSALEGDVIVNSYLSSSP